MSILATGPFDTDPQPKPTKLAQRYFTPVGLALNSVVVPAGGVVSNKFDIECFRGLTVFGTYIAGGFSVYLALGMYDIDDGTLLTRTIFGGFAGAGTTTIFDIGTGSAGSFQGRVFRTCDLQLTQGGGVPPDPTVTVRVWARR